MKAKSAKILILESERCLYIEGVNIIDVFIMHGIYLSTRLVVRDRCEMMSTKFAFD